MTTQQVAWTVDGFNNLAVLYPEYQSPPYTADWKIIDLTISKAETVMVLALDGPVTVVHHTKEAFPLDWKSTDVNLDKVANTPKGSRLPEPTEVLRIDASPDNTLYMVLNSGLLAKINLPEGEESEVEAQLVEGIEHVSQVSAAPDGLVWVVCSDPAIGSVVKWMDPKNGKWKLVPNLMDAQQVTGGPKGKAYIIDSSGKLANYTQKGVKTEIPALFDSRGLSIGPDGRLWVISRFTAEGEEGGSTAFWTDDDGKNWKEVQGSNVINLDAGIIQSEYN